MISPNSFTSGTSSMPVNVEPANLAAGQPDAPVNPLHEHVRGILQNAPLDNDTRANLWDRWHDAQHSYRLKQNLDLYPSVPDDVKASLIAAKKTTDPEHLERLENAVAAIESMATMHPNLLELAENNPNVLQSLLRSK